MKKNQNILKILSYTEDDDINILSKFQMSFVISF